MATRRTGPIIVVGGGVIGTSIAYFLRDADRPITLLEKTTLGSGTTAASIAQFIHHQEEPTREEYARRRQAREWYESRIDSGALSFEQVGTLHLAREGSSEDVAELADAHAELGVAAEELGSDALEGFGLDPDRLAGGVLLPDDGYLDPDEVVEYWAEAARDAGVSIETGVAVTDVHTRAGAVSSVETTAGDYEAATVINAAGPWAPEVDAMVGVSVPLRHTAGPVAVFSTEREQTLPLTFFESGIYLRSHGAKRILAGQFATDYEDGDGFDPDRPPDVEDSFYREVSETVDQYAPGLSGLERRDEWLGLRTVTPDGRPVVGETSVDGYLLAAGMSGYGVTLAPMVGECVATWLTRGEKPDHIASLGPSRFRLLNPELNSLRLTKH